MQTTDTTDGNGTARVCTEKELESVLLSHFRDRVPDLDEVCVSVRQGGAVVRFIVFRPGR